ncbi:MAG TPA: YfcE family phosphodiesterase [Pirellulaceae bacterium]|nr:YfcE family phosphodiesterase [Pirellulaceae bacterium]
MILGVISDTHGHTRRMLDALRILEAFQIGALLHCGDIGSLEMPGLLAPFPSHLVLGNVDEEQQTELENATIAAGQTWHGLEGRLELAGRKIAFTHGHERERLATLIASGEFDLVCYGHTHRVYQHQQGATWVLTPGALYRARVPSCAIVDLVTMRSEILAVG